MNLFTSFCLFSVPPFYILLVLHNFPGTLLFNILFDFLYFLGTYIFHLVPIFYLYFLSYMKYLMLYFPRNFYIYCFTDSFYHHISFSLPVFCFLDFNDTSFLDDPNFFAALLTIAPFSMGTLWHLWHLQCVSFSKL